MSHSMKYNGAITAEKFLFYEMRIAARFYTQNVPIEKAIEEVRKNNLFQYPTERQVSRMVRACYKRLDALENENLQREILSAPMDVAKQINLYAMMCQNRLVWEFMVDVIGEKYRQQDLSFSKKDVYVFLTRLQAQNDEVAGWSPSTISKIDQVLVKILVETEILDNIRASKLNTLLLCEELEKGIRENKDTEALEAFNCFREEREGMI